MNLLARETILGRALLDSVDELAKSGQIEPDLRKLMMFILDNEATLPFLSEMRIQSNILKYYRSRGRVLSVKLEDVHFDRVFEKKITRVSKIPFDQVSKFAHTKSLTVFAFRNYDEDDNAAFRTALSKLLKKDVAEIILQQKITPDFSRPQEDSSEEDTDEGDLDLTTEARDLWRHNETRSLQKFESTVTADLSKEITAPQESPVRSGVSQITRRRRGRARGSRATRVARRSHMEVQGTITQEDAGTVASPDGLSSPRCSPSAITSRQGVRRGRGRGRRRGSSRQLQELHLPDIPVDLEAVAPRRSRTRGRHMTRRSGQTRRHLYHETETLPANTGGDSRTPPALHDSSEKTNTVIPQTKL